jgi:imidazolonepropionase-like amidohydrolase
MPALLIENARVWDGTGADPFPGKVLVEDKHITAVVPDPENLYAEGVARLDAGGKFLMPGMTEGHAHLSFNDVVRGTALGELPPEDHAIATLDAARKLLGAGFTSACSAASAKIRLDVVVRDAIASGRFDGPRLLAASPEITVTGGLGDVDHLHIHQESFGLVADGPDDIRRQARLCLREGVDTIKLNISGDHAVESALQDQTVMTKAEVTAGVEATHAAGRRVSAHARAAAAVKLAVACGVDIIYHCDYADEEALDALESVKDRVFTGPAIGIVIGRIKSLEGDDGEHAQVLLSRLRRTLEASSRTHNEMRKRGIPVTIGGDYGFAANPQGTNAKDLEHFVTHFGFSPSEALQAATRIGGQIMMMGDEIGLIRKGFRADLLLVDGDPLDDVRHLQDGRRLAMIMKDGIRYARTDGPPYVQRVQ